MRATLIGGFVAGVAVATSAHAQLMQPRCGGWPPGRGQPGLVIGAPGVVCYGQVANRVGRRSMITEISVERGPEKGSFRMIGPRDFEYRPNPNMRGHDVIVLRVGRVRDGEEKPYKIRLRATTDANYAEKGGTTTTAPEQYRRGFRRRAPTP